MAEKSLKQEYDEINALLMANETKREAFKKAYDNVEKYHDLLILIFSYFSCIHIENNLIVTEEPFYVDCPYLETEEDLNEFKKYLNSISPEKIEVWKDKDNKLHCQLV